MDAPHARQFGSSRYHPSSEARKPKPEALSGEAEVSNLDEAGDETDTYSPGRLQMATFHLAGEANSRETRRPDVVLHGDTYLRSNSSHVLNEGHEKTNRIDLPSLVFRHPWFP